MHNSEPLLNSAQAAELVGVDRATFNRWAKAGRVRAAIEAPGQTGTRLFERSVVERFAEQREKSRRPSIASTGRGNVLQGRSA